MAFSLLQSLDNIPIAVVDVETTGASAALGHRIIEIGVARIEHGQVVACYEQLIDPVRAVGPAIAALTGIEPGMLRGQPTFDQQMPALLPYLQGAILLGHNIAFDLSFLHREFRRCRLDLGPALDEPHVLDTVRMARRRFGRGGNSLPILSRRLGIDPVTSHRALADARTTAAVFDVLLKLAGGWTLPLVDALAAQGGAVDLARCAGEDRLPWELQEALEMGRPVMMEYLDANQARTQRLVRPLHVRRSNGEMLLVAHCHLRDARRTFKIERIVHLQPVEQDNSPVAGL